MPADDGAAQDLSEYGSTDIFEYRRSVELCFEDWRFGGQGGLLAERLDCISEVLAFAVRLYDENTGGSGASVSIDVIG